MTAQERDAFIAGKVAELEAEFTQVEEFREAFGEGEAMDLSGNLVRRTYERAAPAPVFVPNKFGKAPVVKGTSSNVRPRSFYNDEE